MSTAKRPAIARDVIRAVALLRACVGWISSSAHARGPRRQDKPKRAPITSRWYRVGLSAIAVALACAPGAALARQRPPCGAPHGHCQALWYRMSARYTGGVSDILNYYRSGRLNYAFTITDEVGWDAYADSAVLVRQRPHHGLAILHANLKSSLTHPFPTLTIIRAHETYYDTNGSGQCDLQSNLQQPSVAFKLAMQLHLEHGVFPYQFGAFTPHDVGSDIFYANANAPLGYTCSLSDGDCPINVLGVNPADNPHPGSCYFSGGSGHRDMPAIFQVGFGAFSDGTQRYPIDHAASTTGTTVAGRVGSPGISVFVQRQVHRPNGPYDPNPRAPSDPNAPPQRWELEQFGHSRLTVTLVLCLPRGLSPC